MKTIIVGGVAGGMSAATRLRRLDENAEIIVLERGKYVSFANCGLPYHAGGVIIDRESLLLQTPESLKKRFNLDVRVQHEVVSINPDEKNLVVFNLVSGSKEEISYDNLVLSLGAAPFIPDMEGKEHLLTLRNISDLDRLVLEIEKAQTNTNKAIVIGAGFIGLEVAENLVRKGLHVTLIELADQVLPPLDKSMASFVRDELIQKGVNLLLGSSVISATSDSVTLSDNTTINADLIFASIGVRPELSIASEAGIKIGEKGGVVVDSLMRTSVDSIFAVGDMVEKVDSLTGESSLVALANLANKQGRRVADSIVGLKLNDRTNMGLGTAVVSVFDLTAAMTGMSARRLVQSGKAFESIHIHPNDHAGYYPGAEQMHLVMHFDPNTGEIFGAQGVGPKEVAKKIDVISTAIFGGVSAAELIDLELAYAPQYSSAKDPINMLGYIADGIMNNNNFRIGTSSLNGQLLLDVRTEEEVLRDPFVNAIHIEIDQLRDRHRELEKDRDIVVACQAGQRGHSATMMLRQLGYRAYNLDGGYLTWKSMQ